jgi:NAD(P)-dependent dehydrogenase (short-subunit alcohol dehydrogenase family)
MSGTDTGKPLALVAGASGAIGGAIAARLMTSGWSVVGSYCQHPSTGTLTRWVRYDAATGDGADDLRLAVRQSGRRLAAVFCCIGAPSSKQHMSDTATGEFTDLYAVNALSFVRIWQIIKTCARRDGTSVVAISSDAAASTRVGNGPYSAAKAALHALVLTLAKEEAERGVRVNAVAPSLVDSPLAEEILDRKGVVDRQAYYAGLPWGRPLTTDEVAQVAIDVASGPHWRYATGQIINLSARERDGR